MLSRNRFGAIPRVRLAVSIQFGGTDFQETFGVLKRNSMNMGMWLPQAAVGQQLPEWPPVGTFVPTEAVFPGTNPTVDELIQQLARLSRTDALLWCARLNLVVSNGTHHDDLEKQRCAVHAIFSREEIERIESFAQQARPAKVRVFFRAQLLELIQWIGAHCHDLPGDGETFEDPSVRQAFGKAAMIVSELWENRVYRKFDIGPSMEESRLACLAMMRRGIDAASVGMDPILAIARGRTIFLEHLPHARPSAADEFNEACGLPLESFFAVATIIATHFLLRAPGVGGPPMPGTGIFHEGFFAQAGRELGSVFQTYAKLATQTPAELVGPAGESIGSSPGLARIRRRPMLRTLDGRCIVMDPVFFAEHVAVGPLFEILAKATGRDREQCLADFGDAFQRYCGKLLRGMYPASSVLVDRIECPVTGVAQDGKPVEIADACLNDLTEVVLFEVKSAWLADELTEADDSLRYLNAIKDRYARAAGPESAKGAGQLAKSIAHLARGDWKARKQDFDCARTIYPVLLCYDSHLEGPLHPWFLAKKFREALAPDEEAPSGDMCKGRFRVPALIVLSVDDLEVLERSVEHFSFTKMLHDYSRASPDRICDVRNFLAMSDYRKSLFGSGSLGESAVAALSDAKNLLNVLRDPGVRGFGTERDGGDERE